MNPLFFLLFAFARCHNLQDNFLDAFAFLRVESIMIKSNQHPSRHWVEDHARRYKLFEETFMNQMLSSTRMISNQTEIPLSKQELPNIVLEADTTDAEFSLNGAIAIALLIWLPFTLFVRKIVSMRPKRRNKTLTL